MVLATSERGIVDGGGDAPDGLVADEVADIGDDPGRAGLDELVVVELVEVVGEGLELLLDDHDQRLQWAALRFGDKRVELGLLGER